MISDTTVIAYINLLHTMRKIKLCIRFHKYIILLLYLRKVERFICFLIMLEMIKY